MSGLPEFKEVTVGYARNFIQTVLGNRLIRLEAMNGNAFRAVFSKEYFALGDDQTEVSKSQWNTMKKRMKRVNRDVFIFRRYGTASDGNLYVQFGFFVD
ncbi:MAG: hypothetical protein EA396_13095 [Anaerolineaceae bacterium]|nr:MAG: hypothetical protein EA396_13095 [Anaerolineaceae bacterium]